MHGNTIHLLHCVVTTDPALKDCYNEEVKKYFEDLENKCRDGLFKYLGDVCLFLLVGADSTGLNMWIRLRGSKNVKICIKK